jgi:hypothetical protein
VLEKQIRKNLVPAVGQVKRNGGSTSDSYSMHTPIIMVLFSNMLPLFLNCCR